MPHNGRPRPNPFAEDRFEPDYAQWGTSVIERHCQSEVPEKADAALAQNAHAVTPECKFSRVMCDDDAACVANSPACRIQVRTENPFWSHGGIVQKAIRGL